MAVSMETVIAWRVGEILNGFLLYVGQNIMTSATCVEMYYRNHLGLVLQACLSSSLSYRDNWTLSITVHTFLSRSGYAKLY